MNRVAPRLGTQVTTKASGHKGDVVECKIEIDGFLTFKIEPAPVGREREFFKADDLEILDAGWKVNPQSRDFSLGKA